MSALTRFLVAFAVSASTAVAFTGDMTHFTPGLGACGRFNTEADPVVALSPAQYGNDPNPNNAAVCGRWITIHGNGRTTAAQVVDKCADCPSGSIDVSPVIFDDIAPTSVGRVQVTWEFQ
ncbi:hypothetical protein DL764_010209 [Monosporascus ibericus]|uniref:RlpA-like protein double-psi beta-barrel domain-containing protein n=1 Tax=Monosporascus ibericus TaxID=155417 RepID=A0A4Q4SVU0_9PEZI|nr:hypothetical protein DL764_010209 [Monosporascus ibericus]